MGPPSHQLPQSSNEQEKSSKPPPTPIGWPKPLKEYIKRNFDQCRTDEEKAAMQIKLRPIVTNAVQNNLLLAIDWNNKPLLLLDNKKNMKNKKKQKSKKRK